MLVSSLVFVPTEPSKLWHFFVSHPTWNLISHSSLFCRCSNAASSSFRLVNQILLVRASSTQKTSLFLSEKSCKKVAKNSLKGKQKQLSDGKKKVCVCIDLEFALVNSHYKDCKNVCRLVVVLWLLLAGLQLSKIAVVAKIKVVNALLSPSRSLTNMMES